MKKFGQITLIFCGLLLTLAAFPVFAQNQPIELNRQPLQDFGSLVSSKLKKKEVDLTKPFLIELRGALNQEGKFDYQKTKFVRAEGDGQMIEVAKGAIKAINDGGFFIYLRNLGVENLIVKLSQDEKQFKAAITSETETETRAKTVISALNMFITIGKTKVEDENYKSFLEGTNVSAEGKIFSINVSLPRDKFQEIVKSEINKLPTNE